MERCVSGSRAGSGGEQRLYKSAPVKSSHVAGGPERKLPDLLKRRPGVQRLILDLQSELNRSRSAGLGNSSEAAGEMLVRIIAAGRSQRNEGIVKFGSANVGYIYMPVENVTLQTKGVEYIAKFQPAMDFETASSINDQFVAGIEKNGFLYKRYLPAVENSTYVLRAVAYHGKLFRSVHGVPYNEFDFDKRRDVIIVFRVAYRDTDGSLTIVWSQLSNVDSPKLKLPPVNGEKKTHSNSSSKS